MIGKLRSESAPQVRMACYPPLVKKLSTDQPVLSLDIVRSVQYSSNVISSQLANPALFWEGIFAEIIMHAFWECQAYFMGSQVFFIFFFLQKFTMFIHAQKYIIHI